MIRNVLTIFFILCYLQGCREDAVEALKLSGGPHLFIDDYLISDQHLLTRVVNNPEKLKEPVLKGGDDYDRVFQPYLSVLKDPASGKFRIWFNVPVESKDPSFCHIAVTESDDGIHWDRPPVVLKDPHPIQFNVSVIDRGPDFSDREKRFVMASYRTPGMRISTSADGVDWKSLSEEPVVKHNHDINSLEWDPVHNQYIAVVSHVLKGYGDTTDKSIDDARRIPHRSASSDLVNWEPIRQIIAPMDVPFEQGETQFYSMSGIIARGDLLIGLVKVLRDDLNAQPGKSAKEMGDMNRKAAGIGYTVLAWSRDGRTWQRDYEPFIPNNPQPGTFDHAMAWGDEQVIAGNEIYIYYGGYERGHKIERFDERHIGLAKMPVDRYVSRYAGMETGRLVTKPLIIDAELLSVNARIEGEAGIRLLDDDYIPINGYEWVILTGDSTNHPVKWSNSLRNISGKPVRIEFRLKDTHLFGFSLY